MTTVPLRIEAMRAADLPEVLAIEAASFPAPWPASVFERELAGEDGAVALVARQAVAVETGPVLGTIVYRRVLDEVELHNVAVLPAARGQGIGRRLVEHLLADARAHAATRVLLEVRASNLAARALYARLGFETLATRRGYYHDNGEDALVLARALGAPAEELSR